MVFRAWWEEGRWEMGDGWYGGGWRVARTVLYFCYAGVSHIAVGILEKERYERLAKL